jgi:hypothetical protein
VRRVDKWTESELQVLAQAIESGVPDSQVAARLARTERAVAVKRHALGWTRRGIATPPGSGRRATIRTLARVNRELREQLELIVSAARAHRADDILELALDALHCDSA